jgi:hypothetical protein
LLPLVRSIVDDGNFDQAYMTYLKFRALFREIQEGNMAKLNMTLKDLDIDDAERARRRQKASNTSQRCHDIIESLIPKTIFPRLKSTYQNYQKLIHTSKPEAASESTPVTTGLATSGSSANTTTKESHKVLLPLYSISSTTSVESSVFLSNKAHESSGDYSSVTVPGSSSIPISIDDGPISLEPVSANDTTSSDLTKPRSIAVAPKRYSGSIANSQRLQEFLKDSEVAKEEFKRVIAHLIFKARMNATASELNKSMKEVQTQRAECDKEYAVKESQMRSSMPKAHETAAFKVHTDSMIALSNSYKHDVKLLSDRLEKISAEQSKNAIHLDTQSKQFNKALIERLGGYSDTVKILLYRLKSEFKKQGDQNASQGRFPAMSPSIFEALLKSVVEDFFRQVSPIITEKTTPNQSSRPSDAKVPTQIQGQPTLTFTSTRPQPQADLDQCQQVDSLQGQLHQNQLHQRQLQSHDQLLQQQSLRAQKLQQLQHIQRQHSQRQQDQLLVKEHGVIVKEFQQQHKSSSGSSFQLLKPMDQQSQLARQQQQLSHPMLDSSTSLVPQLNASKNNDESLSRNSRIQAISNKPVSNTFATYNKVSIPSNADSTDVNVKVDKTPDVVALLDDNADGVRKSKLL